MPHIATKTTSPRYRVGCAGMCMLGMDYGVDSEDEAIADRGDVSAPMGCEVYDTLTKTWIGPTCQEEIDEAVARLRADKED